MRRLLVTAAAVLGIVLQGVTQSHSFHPVKDVEAFRKKFSTESSRIQSITSDFKQQKQLVALTETITSTGKFWFRRADKVRIEYQQPFVYRMIMNGDKMSVKDDQKENTVNVKSNKLFQQINRIMVDCVQGTILDSKDFSITVFESDGEYKMQLEPTSKNLKTFFENIILLVDKRDSSVNSIQMNEPGGDSTTISFSHKVLNQPVSDELFKI